MVKIRVVLLMIVLLLCGCRESLVKDSPPEVKPPAVGVVLPKEIEFLAPVLEIDKIYPSMKGPVAGELVALTPKSKELSWLTGFESLMVGPDGKVPESQEYMCHTNLDIASPEQHIQRNLNARFNPGRLFTISQGQPSVKFPEGFGIPLLLGTPLEVTAQALNLNGVPEKPFKVRHKMKFSFIENRELKKPMVPLFATTGLLLKAMNDGATHYGVDNKDMQGGGCLIGPKAGESFKDEHDNEFTPHWVVKPGREENRTVVTEMLAIPYDTTLHYVLAHVHPFCESMELRDMETGESVLKLDMLQHDDKIGLSKTEHFSSVEGIPVFKDRAYEMISVYNNTSGADQDAMAVMIMFMADKEFKVPKPGT